MVHGAKIVPSIITPLLIASVLCAGYMVFALHVPHTVEACLDLVVARIIYWASLLIILAPATIIACAVVVKHCEKCSRMTVIASGILLIGIVVILPEIILKYWRS